MLIGLHDSDRTGFPNLALMKISAWHKARGDIVEWWNPMLTFDRVYSSKSKKRNAGRRTHNDL